MRIAVDLDGVCYHWDRTARYMLRRWYLERYERYPEALDHPSATWDAIQQAVDPCGWEWLWNEGVHDGLYRHGHIVGGTIEGLTALAREGHELVVATARPPEAVGDTLAWISLHFHRVPVLDIRFEERKLRVRADVYLDDGAHNIVKLAAAGRDCIVFDQPWNQNLDLVTDGHGYVARAYSWIGSPMANVLDCVRLIQEMRS